jgi:glucokinase
MPTTYLLTGDIGGTNSRMGLYSVDDNIPLADPVTYRNQDVLASKMDGIFERHVIAPFLQYCWETNINLAPLEDVEIVACLAIAGPVRNNMVCMSNLHDIVIDGTCISKQIHSKDPYLAKIKVCKIINDFVAQGYGCLTLKPGEVKELNPGSHAKIDPAGPKVCVGAGTGLGECFLTPDAEGVYSCFPSEGGHVEWAPRNDLEIKLWKYVKAKFEYRHRVSIERVVSGRGLANCYEFLAKEFPDRVDKKVHAEFEKGGDLQGKVVSDQAHSTKGSLGEQALEIMCRYVLCLPVPSRIHETLFVVIFFGDVETYGCLLLLFSPFSAYGCEVGSAGVKFIPTGGLYVTGGLTPKNMRFIEGQDSPFMKAYHDKGRVKAILDNVPLFAVLVEDLGVRGALKSAQIEYHKYHHGVGITPTSTKDKNKDTDMGKLLQMSAVAAVGIAVGMVLSKRN